MKELYNSTSAWTPEYFWGYIVSNENITRLDKSYNVDRQHIGEKRDFLVKNMVSDIVYMNHEKNELFRDKTKATEMVIKRFERMDKNEEVNHCLLALKYKLAEFKAEEK